MLVFVATTHTSNDTGMADSMGTVPSLRKRHDRHAAAIAANFVSGTSGDERCIEADYGRSRVIR